jgi:hypothetical protein
VEHSLSSPFLLLNWGPPFCPVRTRGPVSDRASLVGNKYPPNVQSAENYSTLPCRNRCPPPFHTATGALHFFMPTAGAVHFSMLQRGLSTFPCRNRRPLLFHAATGPSTFSCRNRSPLLFHAARGPTTFPMPQQGSQLFHAATGLSTFSCRNRAIFFFMPATGPSTFSCRNRALHFSHAATGVLHFPYRNRSFPLFRTAKGALPSPCHTQQGPSPFTCKGPSILFHTLSFSMQQQVLSTSLFLGKICPLLYSSKGGLSLFAAGSFSPCHIKCSLLLHAPI